MFSIVCCMACSLILVGRRTSRRSGSVGAKGGTRTPTPVRRQDLNLVRLPISPPSRRGRMVSSARNGAADSNGCRSGNLSFEPCASVAEWVSATTRTSRSHRCSRRRHCDRDSGDLPVRPDRRRHRRRGRCAARRAPARPGASCAARSTRSTPAAAGRLAGSRAAPVRAHALPLAAVARPARRLRAGRRHARYANFDELLDYCRRSANPVGRLLLQLFGRSRRAARRRGPTRSARRCSSPTSGRTSRSTGTRAASTCRRRTSRASA